MRLEGLHRRVLVPGLEAAPLISNLRGSFLRKAVASLLGSKLAAAIQFQACTAYGV
jgi:hypothetical protein